MEDSTHPHTHLLNIMNFFMNGTYCGIFAQSKNCGAGETARLVNGLETTFVSRQWRRN
jgi:hypothetical protein